LPNFNTICQEGEESTEPGFIGDSDPISIKDDANPASGDSDSDDNRRRHWQKLA